MTVYFRLNVTAIARARACAWSCLLTERVGAVCVWWLTAMIVPMSQSSCRLKHTQPHTCSLPLRVCQERDWFGQETACPDCPWDRKRIGCRVCFSRCCRKKRCCCFKGIVQPKKHILSSFTRVPAVPNLYDVRSSNLGTPCPIFSILEILEF